MHFIDKMLIILAEIHLFSKLVVPNLNNTISDEKSTYTFLNGDFNVYSWNPS